MNQLRLGYVFGIGAHTLWGFFPAYFKLLRPSGPIEVLAHRIAWSCLFMVILLTILRGWRRIGVLLRQPRKVAAITAAAVLIGLNWGTYIWAVNADRVVETALGYFITPLVSILLGMVFLAERLRSWQWTAVAIGTAAVVVLTVDYGRLPWVAFALACSFGLYGLVKKQLGLPAADGLFVESAVLAVPAVATLLLLPSQTFGHVSTAHTLLIAASGAITAVPLLMFAGAANRIPLISLGMLQYIGPTIQLFLGVFAFHEPMPPGRLAGFVLVWIALVIFSWDGLRQRQRQQMAPGLT